MYSWCGIPLVDTITLKPETVTKTVIETVEIPVYRQQLNATPGAFGPSAFASRAIRGAHVLAIVLLAALAMHAQAGAQFNGEPPGGFLQGFGSGAFVFVGLTADLPAHCLTSELAFATDATAGQNIYGCTAPGVWTQQGGGGGGGIGGSIAANQIAFGSGADAIEGTANATLDTGGNAILNTLNAGNAASAPGTPTLQLNPDSSGTAILLVNSNTASNFVLTAVPGATFIGLSNSMSDPDDSLTLTASAGGGGMVSITDSMGGSASLQSMGGVGSLTLNDLTDASTLTASGSNVLLNGDAIVSATNLGTSGQPCLSNANTTCTFAAASVACGGLPALTGDTTTSAGSCATTTKAINGTALSGLATGVLYNTTATGVPSIATAAQLQAAAALSTYLASPPAIGGTVPSTGSFTIMTATQNALATSQVDAAILQNTTLGTVLVPAQNSPALHFIAHSWQTATSGDQQDDFIQFNRAITGSFGYGILSMYATSNGSSPYFIGSEDAFGDRIDQGYYTAIAGPVTSPTFATAANCSSSASPAVCGSAAAGSVALPTNAVSSSVQVNTSAVTANSQVVVATDDTLGTKLGVTCNSTVATLVGGLTISARNPGVSFTIANNVAVVANPLCVSYSIVN